MRKKCLLPHYVLVCLISHRQLTFTNTNFVTIKSRAAVRLKFLIAINLSIKKINLS